MGDKIYKIGFEVEVDEGAMPPSLSEFAHALTQGLPKEYWADSRCDRWGIVSVYPLNFDGTLSQSDVALRPVDWEKKATQCQALLAHEQQLTDHLDGKVRKLKAVVEDKGVTIKTMNSQLDQAEAEVYRKGQLVEDWTEKSLGQAGVIEGQNRTITGLRAVISTREAQIKAYCHEISGLRFQVKNLEEKNGNQSRMINDYVAEAQHLHDVIDEKVQRILEVEEQIFAYQERGDALLKEVHVKQDRVDELENEIVVLKEKTLDASQEAKTKIKTTLNLREMFMGEEGRVKELKERIDELEAEAGTTEQLRKDLHTWQRLAAIREDLAVHLQGRLNSRTWGDDKQLTQLEEMWEKTKGHVQSSSDGLLTALAYLEDLGAVLDEIRTER